MSYDSPSTRRKSTDKEASSVLDMYRNEVRRSSTASASAGSSAGGAVLMPQEVSHGSSALPSPSVSESKGADSEDTVLGKPLRSVREDPYEGVGKKRPRKQAATKRTRFGSGTAVPETGDTHSPRPPMHTAHDLPRQTSPEDEVSNSSGTSSRAFTMDEAARQAAMRAVQRAPSLTRIYSQAQSKHPRQQQPRNSQRSMSTLSNTNIRRNTMRTNSTLRAINSLAVARLERYSQSEYEQRLFHAKVLKAFQEFDVNGDGFISAGELGEALQDLQRISQLGLRSETVSRLYNELQADSGHSRVDYSAFAAALEREHVRSQRIPHAESGVTPLLEAALGATETESEMTDMSLSTIGDIGANDAGSTGAGSHDDRRRVPSGWSLDVGASGSFNNKKSPSHDGHSTGDARHGQDTSPNGKQARRNPSSESAASAMLAEQQSLKRLRSTGSPSLAYNPEVARAFSLYDLDGDGEIAVWELATILHTLGKTASPAMINTVMMEVDQNNSGTIDFYEFLQVFNFIHEAQERKRQERSSSRMDAEVDTSTFSFQVMEVFGYSSMAKIHDMAKGASASLHWNVYVTTFLMLIFLPITFLVWVTAETRQYLHNRRVRKEKRAFWTHLQQESARARPNSADAPANKMTHNTSSVFPLVGSDVTGDSNEDEDDDDADGGNPGAERAPKGKGGAGHGLDDLDADGEGEADEEQVQEDRWPLLQFAMFWVVAGTVYAAVLFSPIAYYVRLPPGNYRTEVFGPLLLYVMNCIMISVAIGVEDQSFMVNYAKMRLAYHTVVSSFGNRIPAIALVEMLEQKSDLDDQQLALSPEVRQAIRQFNTDENNATQSWLRRSLVINWLLPLLAAGGHIAIFLLPRFQEGVSFWQGQSLSNDAYNIFYASLLGMFVLVMVLIRTLVIAISEYHKVLVMVRYFTSFTSVDGPWLYGLPYVNLEVPQNIMAWSKIRAFIQSKKKINMRSLEAFSGFLLLVDIVLCMFLILPLFFDDVNQSARFSFTLLIAFDVFTLSMLLMAVIIISKNVNVELRKHSGIIARFKYKINEKIVFLVDNTSAERQARGPAGGGAMGAGLNDAVLMHNDSMDGDVMGMGLHELDSTASDDDFQEMMMDDDEDEHRRNLPRDDSTSERAARGVTGKAAKATSSPVLTASEPGLRRRVVGYSNSRESRGSGGSLGSVDAAATLEHSSSSLLAGGAGAATRPTLAASGSGATNMSNRSGGTSPGLAKHLVNPAMDVMSISLHGQRTDKSASMVRSVSATSHGSGLGASASASASARAGAGVGMAGDSQQMAGSAADEMAAGQANNDFASSGRGIRYAVDNTPSGDARQLRMCHQLLEDLEKVLSTSDTYFTLLGFTLDDKFVKALFGFTAYVVVTVLIRVLVE